MKTPTQRFLSLPLIALALVALGASNPAVAAQGDMSLEGGFGANICLTNGDASCDAFDPLVYGRLGFHYSITDFLSLGLDVDAGGFNYDGNSDVWAVHVIAVARAQFEAGPLRLMAGLGAGYGHLELAVNSSSVDPRFTVDALTIKVPGLVAYPLTDNLWLGAEVSFYAHVAGEACGRAGGVSVCGDIDDVQFNLQLGAFVGYQF